MGGMDHGLLGSGGVTRGGAAMLGAGGMMDGGQNNSSQRWPHPNPWRL